ncbi:MAG: hypothetical protein HUJ62_01320 [Streptococcus gallolyticus]|nr:hypothetical protein [Streptococcus gallolyticus]
MAEVIFRTKLRRLTNASHYALAEQMLNKINSEFIVAGRMQHSLTLLQNAIAEEKKNIYKVVDTTQSERLQEMISAQNKYFTSISSMLKTFAENPIDETYRVNADKLYGEYKAYMSKRDEKTIGDWIGSAKALCQIWGTDESTQSFDAIQLKNVRDKIITNQNAINDLYSKYLSDVADRGYSKSAIYRTNTDNYMTIVCSDLHVQTICEEPNVAARAELLIEGLNAMINRFGGRRPEEEMPANSSDEELAAEPLHTISENDIDDEENVMAVMNSEQKSVKEGNQKTIDDISETYDNMV